LRALRSKPEIVADLVFLPVQPTLIQTSPDKGKPVNYERPLLQKYFQEQMQMWLKIAIYRNKSQGFSKGGTPVECAPVLFGGIFFSVARAWAMGCVP